MKADLPNKQINFSKEELEATLQMLIQEHNIAADKILQFTEVKAKLKGRIEMVQEMLKVYGDAEQKEPAKEQKPVEAPVEAKPNKEPKK